MVDGTRAVSLDEALNEVSLQQQALGMLTLVEGQAAKRQDMIVRKLVQSHISGTLTNDEASAGIAGIAELRRLVSDLRRVAGVEVAG